MKPERVARMYLDGAFRPVIVGTPGRKVTWVLYNVGTGVRVQSVSRREADQAPTATYKGAEYPLKRAQRILRQAARRGPCPKKAKILLKGAP